MQLVNIDQYKKAIVNGERAFCFISKKVPSGLLQIWKLAVIHLVTE